MIPETGPGVRALLQHVLNKPFKVIIVTFVPEGTANWDVYFEPWLRKGDNVYGEDYVFLGFVAGTETGMRAFSQNMRSVINTDYYGTPIDDLPIMEGINHANQADVVITGGAFYCEEVVMQVQPIANTPIIIQCSAGGATGGMGFYPQTAIGILTGIRGGAEYEALVGRLGLATSTLDGIQVGMITMLIFIVLGNIIYLGTKKNGGEL
jgi:hypothetical protein